MHSLGGVGIGSEAVVLDVLGGGLQEAFDGKEGEVGSSGFVEQTQIVIAVPYGRFLQGKANFLGGAFLSRP